MVIIQRFQILESMALKELRLGPFLAGDIGAEFLLTHMRSGLYRNCGNTDGPRVKGFIQNDDSAASKKNGFSNSETSGPLVFQ